ncbi:hypothetical protein ACQP2Y_21605 [Actinoplanes sp. CA-051413]|uniref:hypothetical protein n=1 Tax=Actinoplanes sp. CA-051413 TaxID=3239899 RepID=UPI003D970D0D
MANPKFVTLVADTEAIVDLDTNYGQIEVTLTANAANTWFNTANTAVGAVAGAQDGNHYLGATLPTKIVPDLTGGQNSRVRIRSTGTPTVQVYGS